MVRVNGGNNVFVFPHEQIGCVDGSRLMNVFVFPHEQIGCVDVKPHDPSQPLDRLCQLAQVSPLRKVSK